MKLKIHLFNNFFEKYILYKPWKDLYNRWFCEIPVVKILGRIRNFLQVKKDPDSWDPDPDKKMFRIRNTDKNNSIKIVENFSIVSIEN
jgi:hypothetical protein